MFSGQEQEVEIDRSLVEPRCYAPYEFVAECQNYIADNQKQTVQLYVTFRKMECSLDETTSWRMKMEYEPKLTLVWNYTHRSGNEAIYSAEYELTENETYIFKPIFDYVYPERIYYELTYSTSKGTGMSTIPEVVPLSGIEIPAEGEAMHLRILANCKFKETETIPK